MPFDKDAPAGNDGGYLPAGTGWYRKAINVSPESIGKKRQLYFEGAYMNTDVYVNGHLAGNNPYGWGITVQNQTKNGDSQSSQLQTAKGDWESILHYGKRHQLCQWIAGPLGSDQT